MHWPLCVCKPYDISLVLGIFSFQSSSEDSGTARIERSHSFTPSWLFSYIIIQNNICFICYIQV